MSTTKVGTTASPAKPSAGKENPGQVCGLTDNPHPDWLPGVDFVFLPGSETPETGLLVPTSSKQDEHDEAPRRLDVAWSSAVLFAVSGQATFDLLAMS